MTDSCANCKFGVTVADVIRCQRYAPSPSPNITAKWPAVLNDDWCGDFTPVGAGLQNQYLRGIAKLQSVFVPTALLSVPAPLATGILTYDTIVMRSCQVVNTATKDDCIIAFLDGNDPSKAIGFVSCPSHQTMEFQFDPGIVASPGNGIFVDIDQDLGTSWLYITAQGFVVRG